MTDSAGRGRTLAEYARRGDRESLLRGALLIATIEHPRLDPEPTLSAIAAMGHEAARWLAGLPAGDVEARVAALNAYLFEDLGFHGNEERYDDPRNSFLNDVVARRTGIPIALAVLYREVGLAAGLSVEGVNFPGHFLVRVLPPPETSAAGGELVVDPFHGGALLNEAECRRLLERHMGAEAALTPDTMASADTPQILIRMLTNLKRLYVRSRSFPQALEATDLLVALDPDSLSELRDRGLLAYQLRRLPEARRDLERYLQSVAPVPQPLDEDVRKQYEQIWEHVKTLRRRMAGLN